MQHHLRFLIIVATLLAVTSPLSAQLPVEDAALPGTYVMQRPQGPFVVKIAVSGTALTGSIDFAGQYFTRLNGEVSGSRASGEFTMTATGATEGGSGTFVAGVEGDTLGLVLTQEAAPGQTATRLPLKFQRVQGAAAIVPVATEPVAAPAESAGDDLLVGNWVHQTLIVSGDASMASESYLAFRADGTYFRGSGQSVAGGGNWSWDGGSSGVTERGRWQARDGILYFLGQDGQWMRAGKYGMTTDGSTMRITNDNGGKVLWSRQ